MQRRQEKKVHTFQLGDVTVGLDTWPLAPTYVELEGPSEAALKKTASQLGLEWTDAVFVNALEVLEQYFHIPASTYRYYTFDRVE